MKRYENADKQGVTVIRRGKVQTTNGTGNGNGKSKGRGH
jgi:hypothetical protein